MDALLGAVWLYSTDVARTAAFYRDSVGLRLVEEEPDVAHFDAGNIRISIHPWHRHGKPGSGGFYVFIVAGIEAEVERLSARGVDFPDGITEEAFGRIAEFRDPDGHELFLWQLPDEGTEAYERIRPLAEHHARLVSALDV